MFRTYLPLSTTLRVAAHTYPRTPPGAHLGSVAATFAKSQRHTSPRTASNILRPPTLTTSLGAHRHGGERFSSSPGPKSTRPLEGPAHGPVPMGRPARSRAERYPRTTSHGVPCGACARRAASQPLLAPAPRRGRCPECHARHTAPRIRSRPTRRAFAHQHPRRRACAPGSGTVLREARALMPYGTRQGGKRAGRARGTRRWRAAPPRPRSARSREKSTSSGLEISLPSCAAVRALSCQTRVYRRKRAFLSISTPALRVPVVNPRAGSPRRRTAPRARTHARWVAHVSRATECLTCGLVVGPPPVGCSQGHA